MQQTMTTFMKSHSNQQSFTEISELALSMHPDINTDRLLSRSFLFEHAIFKWNFSNIGFFNSYYNEKTTATAFVIKHSEKDVYFRDVYFFLKRCSDIVTIKNDQLVRNNLFIFLWELALQWYISEMITNVKTLIKFASNIDHWITKLLKRFKEKFNVALFVLIKEKYIFDDARNQGESREYTSIILKAIKSTNLAVSN